MRGKKLAIGLASFFYLITGCTAMTKNATEFDWYATECGPDGYPMEIISGEFKYKDKSGGLYIPSGGTLFTGWGKSVSHHVVGPAKKPLPDRLEINYYSFAEKLFYRGSFELPYEKILALFRQANIDRPGKPYYRSIMVGVAPGGAVSVWVNGARRTEVFFGQAEKYEQLPFPMFGLPLETKEESDAYIAKQLVNVLEPEQLESLKKNGIPFGVWARYRNLYKWVPVFKNKNKTDDDDMPVHFLNGELAWIPTQYDKDDEITLRPLPRHIEVSVDVLGEYHFYIIEFEEFELMEAFEKLGAKGETVYLELDAQVPRENMKIRLYNDQEPKDENTPKEFIELKKVFIKPQL